MRMQLSLVTSPLNCPRRGGGDPASCPPPRAFWQDWGRVPPRGWGPMPYSTGGALGAGPP